MAAIWKNGSLQRGDTYSIHKAEGLEERTIGFNGQWAAVEAASPGYGAAVAGMPGFVVIDSLARRKKGGGGELVVTMRRRAASVAASGAAGILEDKISVRWVRSQRALTDNAYFVAGSASDAKISQIECWKREKDHALRDAFKFRAPVLYGTTQVVWEEFEITDAKTLKLARKIKAGQTGYWWWYPVVRRRRVFAEPPTPDLPVPTIKTAALLQTRVAAEKIIRKIDGDLKQAKKHIPLVGREKDAAGSMSEFTYSYMLVGMEIDEADDDQFSITEEWIGAKEFDTDYYGS